MSSSAQVQWDEEPKKSPAVQWDPEPSTWQKIKTGATDLTKGAGEGLLQTGMTLSPLLNKIPYVGEMLAPSAGIRGAEDLATPANATQKVGKVGEQIAEIAVPVGLAAKEAQAAGKLIPFAARAGTSLVGSLAGSEVGKYGGRYVGGETGGEIGQIVGGLTGGLAGGGTFGENARKIGNPRELPVVGKYLPDLLKTTPKVISPEPFQLTSETPVREPAVQTRMTFPKEVAPEPAPIELPKVEPFKKMPAREINARVDEAMGQKPLPMNEPLFRRPVATPESVGAAASKPAVGIPPIEPGGPGNFGGRPTFRNPATLRQPDIQGGVIKAPEKIPTIVTEEPMRQMGAPPLRPNVPFKEQWKPMNEPNEPSPQAKLEEKYPDKAIRQMVHSNGEEIVQAVGGDQETLKAIHDMSNVDVRQAAINLGEDMGQRSIGNRKAMGESQISRQEMFKRLLAKGFSPKQIVEAGKIIKGETK